MRTHLKGHFFSLGTLLFVTAALASATVFQNCSPGFEVKTFSSFTELASEMPTDPGSPLDGLPGTGGGTTPGSSPTPTPAPGATPAPTTPLFSSSLAPILEARCIQCHST